MGLQPGEWRFRRVGSLDPAALDSLLPGSTGWIPATVPGDVQTDLMEAGEIPTPYVDRQSLACEWTSQRDWVYVRDVTLPAEGGDRALLHFDGVDYSCHVFVNGVQAGSHAGTYTPFEFDVSGAVIRGASNRIVVVVEAAPTEPGQQGQLGCTSEIRIWKPRFAYGWDWCTRLVPLGIWESVTLTLDDGRRLTGVAVRATLKEVAVTANAEVGDSPGCVVEVNLSGPEGERVGRAQAQASSDASTMVTIAIDDAALWWPNGFGAHPLYRADVRLLAAGGEVLDSRTVRFGVRSVRWEANQDTYEGALPYQLEINGRVVPIRGWNWVPLDQLYGRTHDREYRHLLRLARDAGCNLLRVWGGGLLERELFYDLCDEYGIMVWQEFFQSSSGANSEPATDADYLAYIHEQAQQIVPRRVNHPSLVIWCGGNELAGVGGQPLDVHHPAVAVLAAAVARLDPDRLFLPTSPSGPLGHSDALQTNTWHDIHGPWLHCGDPGQYHFYNTISPLLHSEFGVEGMTNHRTLDRAISASHRWPVAHQNPVMNHHGSWWLSTATVESMFGIVDDLRDLIRASQWLQADGLRYALESHRRRAGHCAGTIPWQFNEAFPNAACTNVIDFYGYPKPAYWTAKAAYAPAVVSAAFDTLRWPAGGRWSAHLHLSSDDGGDAGSVRWRLLDLLAAGALVAEGSGTDDACASLPDRQTLLLLDLRAGDIGNSYIFSTFVDAPLRSLLHLPTAAMTVSVEGGRTLAISCETGGAGLAGVSVQTQQDHGGPYLSCGYFPHLAPGAELRVDVDGAGPLIVSAWNAAPVTCLIGW
ncbi:MAG: glycoside hydrolase family 2 protein [Candidatus Dormibacteria bacterium]